MTKVTLSITVAESVDVAALGRWLEAWIRDQWDGHGEPCTMGLGQGIRGLAHLDLHLVSIEAKPPASGRKTIKAFSQTHAYDCDCGACLPSSY